MPLWMALCSTRRRLSTVSPVKWRCKHGKQRPHIFPVPVLEKGIITDFAKKARSQLIKEGNFMAARALDFLLCGAIHEPHLPADGTIPNLLFCIRCDQNVVATRKHELWECPGNDLINHTHMKESEYLTSLAQEFWDTDQVLFARGLLPRDSLPASEVAECNEVKMWESVDFNACAKKPCVVRLGRIWGQLENFPNTETGRMGGQVPGTLGRHPNSQPSRWEIEHPNSD